MIKCYTDGSCPINDGKHPGGWAYILDINKEASGRLEASTNNRAELTAVIEGLKATSGSIEVYCDSAYIVNCFKDGWWQKWLKNGWKSSTGNPVLNQDLWQQLLALTANRDVTFKKVKGHADDILNNRCDKLAKKAVAKT